MSAKFPRGGGANPFSAINLTCLQLQGQSSLIWQKHTRVYNFNDNLLSFNKETHTYLQLRGQSSFIRQRNTHVFTHMFTTHTVTTSRTIFHHLTKKHTRVYNFKDNLLSFYKKSLDLYPCPIEIIIGLTDKEQFQYLTKIKGPQEGTYLYTTQFLSLR